jgi:hypothetical protein
MRIALLLMAGALVAWAQRPMTVAELTALVKSQIKVKGNDKDTADFLRKVKLTEKLEDKTIEELQGMGAGPKTVAALRTLEEASKGLAAAAVVVAKAPVAPPHVMPPPGAEEQGEALSAMREYALNYTEKLPNYLCRQTTRRHQESNDRRYPPENSVIEEQLSFNDHMETYKVRMINGKSVDNVSHDQLNGVRSSGEFGTMLREIFDPVSEARFEWDHWGTWDGRLVEVFNYRIEKEHGYTMRDDVTQKRYTSAYTGLVYADKDTKTVVRVTLKTVEIPSDFTVKEVSLALNYKATEIAGQSYMLPALMELDSKLASGTAKNTAEFRMYQKYSADAVLSFDDDPAEKKKQP